MSSWSDLNLSADLLKLVEAAGFSTPTPVQAATIPLALEGRDILASAQTGSGKTASFVLPMVERLTGKEGTFGLILAPTREIALQTQETLIKFGHPRGVRSAALIGGVPLTEDAAALKTYPQVIVATPGRLCDHLDRGNVWLEFIQMLVLDEADRMLDMGFSAQLSRIMEDLPNDRQTLFFSATIPPLVEKLANKVLYEPERVAIGSSMAAAPEIDQRVIFVPEEAKLRELMKLFSREPGSIIIFVRSKDGATRLWRSLHSRGVYDATVIHSDRRQQDREQALADFKSGKYRILVATDVAGRGIHVDDVAHVVNYDIPREPEDYIHRIGRTGRKGARGRATSFATGRDRPMLRDIERILNQSRQTLGIKDLDQAGNDAPRAQGQRPYRREGGRPSGGGGSRPRPRGR